MKFQPRTAHSKTKDQRHACAIVILVVIFEICAKSSVKNKKNPMIGQVLTRNDVFLISFIVVQADDLARQLVLDGIWFPR